MTRTSEGMDDSWKSDVALGLADFFTGTQSRFEQLQNLAGIGAPIDPTEMHRFHVEMHEGLSTANELIRGLGAVAVLMQDGDSGTTETFPVRGILGFGGDGSVQFLSAGPQGNPLAIGWGDNCSLHVAGH